MTRLRLATQNAGKVREFREMLEPLGHTVVGMDDLGLGDIAETGATFEENALIKAEAVFRASQEPTLADDSGLEVDALHGAPGVYSARFAGVTGPEQDASNRAKLLEEMQGIAERERTARFICALVLFVPDRGPLTFKGSLEGRIAFEEQGEGGFGYDSIFYVPSLDRTTAQLNPDEKNLISHRGQALQQLLSHLKDQPL
jgi:XTP/dITP diphosphohydrolase